LENIILKNSTFTNDYIIQDNCIVLLPHTYICIDNEFNLWKKYKYKKSIFMSLIPDTNLKDFLYFYSKNSYKAINIKLIDEKLLKTYKVITFEEIAEIRDMQEPDFIINNRIYRRIEHKYVDITDFVQLKEENVRNIEINTKITKPFITNKDKWITSILKTTNIGININWNIVILINLILLFLLSFPYGTLLTQKNYDKGIIKELSKKNISSNKIILKNIYNEDKKYKTEVKTKISFLKNKNIKFKKSILIDLSKKYIIVDGEKK